MLFVLINWGYIFILTSLIGYGFFKLLSRFLNFTPEFSLTGATVCGIAVSTVYSQIISIFGKVGLFANFLLIVLCALIFTKNHTKLYDRAKKTLKNLLSWEGLLYICVILFIAFCTSRGELHADTKMYHAQAIRWYEEYGVVKGLGNLQWHFAYNSAYFAFAALFSMNFAFGQSLHCTTGFITILLCLWALNYLKNFFIHKRHITDMCCIGILFYTLVNLTGCVSPASDYATMFFSLYLISRWSEEIEKGNKNIHSFAILSVFSVYIVSLKLSAGLLVLLVIFPAFYLIKSKEFKSIFIYLTLGIITILPFLVRNVIISGWLLYPFSAIDLFNFDWKIPLKYVEIDSAQIKVWARCLYDPKLIDMPFNEWLPIWWQSQERYSQMLILTNFLAIALNLSILTHKIFNKIKLCWNLILLNLVTIVCIISWLFLAPFIRYGLAFLLALPMLSVGMWMQKEKSSFYKLVSGCIVLLMFFILTPYWDHYFTDDMVFIKQNLFEPYYIEQKDYDTSPMTEYDMNGLTVYCPEQGEVTGYNHFPASAYSYMITNTELRGDSIKDGFRSLE